MRNHRIRILVVGAIWRPSSHRQLRQVVEQLPLTDSAHRVEAMCRQKLEVGAIWNSSVLVSIS